MLNKFTWTEENSAAFWNLIWESPLAKLAFGLTAGDRLLDLLNKYLDETKEVLDLGGGSGHLALKLLERGSPTAIYDPSETSLSAAQLDELSIHKHFLGVIKLYQKKQYDIVILSEVIEHLLDHQLSNVAEDAASKVKPGGILVITAPNGEDLESNSSICPQCNAFFHRWQHQRSVTKKEILNLFVPCGMREEMSVMTDFSNLGLLIKEHQKLYIENIQLKKWCGLKQSADPSIDIEKPEKILRHFSDKYGGYGQLIIVLRKNQ